ncbi:beta-lactamase/transpeptidase-like protein [Cercophora scortea]|uniref:Beta-lactamase/transpeptidase-like protein n=1 Tax=Cercophora scortea TaxID=314031 RepID=A0AAE0M7G0_9PEZI|nr:beta-lactamase/transpeptidase-like protein [Cercophora scortea]
MSSAFEAKIERAIEDGTIAGVVVLAKDKTGKLNYAKALGHASLDPAGTKPMQLDTVFTLASMTKLLTAVAVLQLVDRGLITLDTDITPHLPTLAALPILTGFDASNAPILTPRTTPLLVRHLLTHSSGCSYPFMQPLLDTWAKQQPPPPQNPTSGPTVDSLFGYPLVFEPGTSWIYGSGLDWAGKLVEVLSGTDLDTYLATHILAPLNLPASSITFYPERHTLTTSRLASFTTRDPETNRVTHHAAPLALAITTPTRSAFGGQGASADLNAYIAVLHSLLVDDGKLLSAATAQALFTPLLREPEAKAALRKAMETPEWVVGVVPDTGEYDWSPGGLLVDGDRHEYRRRGCLLWGGAFNLSWFIDREAGVCGVFGTQIAQPADPLVRPLMEAFEDAVYARL